MSQIAKNSVVATDPLCFYRERLLLEEKYFAFFFVISLIFNGQAPSTRL